MNRIDYTRVYELNKLGKTVREISTETGLRAETISHHFYVKQIPHNSDKWVNKVASIKIGSWIYQNSEGVRGNRKFQIWKEHFDAQQLKIR